ncbi:DUF2059 domain-containing protein [uncultured Gemmobacter sp.]|uniref:DUF2059 domain-containing protein n=1 Tax=uncultured Gemmobacter sp. TaxID=1095917 RepID=UPI000A6D0BE4|nr:DUF2059 domain-containing protein [uncultured Gemmobacter sp.]
MSKFCGPVAILAVMLAMGQAPLAHAEAPTGAPAAGASIPAGLTELTRTLHIDELIAVMRAEGLDYGAALKTEMLPDKAPAAWEALVSHIYDPGRMQTEFETALAQELTGAPEVIAAAEAFFGDARGQKILSLEIEARQALLDDKVEEAAQAAVARMEAEGAPRLEALHRFAEANDLVEMNVMGAMNANLAFYRGLNAGGAFGDAMSEADMLAEVWGQEAQVRSEAEDWLWPYLSLAYQPLSDEELQAYQRFSESPEGKRLNAAVFAAFDGMFVRISTELGLAAGRQMLGEDI